MMNHLTTAEQTRISNRFWMPFTENKRYLSEPIILKRAEGLYYWDEKDRAVLDATSGMWCVNAGHRHPRIVSAIQKQLEVLDYASCFRTGHSGVFELADRICAMAPGNLSHVFFANSGSEAVDTALKLAVGYHALRGQQDRKIIVGRDRDYHGVGFGGMAVSGFPKNRQHFNVFLNDIEFIPHTHDVANMAFSRGEPDWGIHLADSLNDIIKKHGGEKIAAVIVEPVAGSTGVLVPPKDYLKRLREICDQHGILLIFDEVITGFGRLGKAFAAEFFGIQPDIITCAKGITSGVIPLGAAILSEDIYHTFLNSRGDEVEFLHGYTYSGHPIACAAALGALNAYEEERMFVNAELMAKYFEEKLHALKNLPGVIDVRNLGLMGAVELGSSANTMGERAYRVFRKCFELGVLVRVTGNTIALSPPLCIDRKHIDKAIEVLSESILCCQAE